jgi:hypothetical protein
MKALPEEAGKYGSWKSRQNIEEQFCMLGVVRKVVWPQAFLGTHTNTKKMEKCATVSHCLLQT